VQERKRGLIKRKRKRKWSELRVYVQITRCRASKRLRRRNSRRVYVRRRRWRRRGVKR